MIRALVLGVLCFGLHTAAAAIYEVTEGQVRFRSNAPQELIHARSNELHGVLDTEHRTFAFRVPITSFRGFNSALQREHFNENYMESEVYPQGTFTGKIIEDLPLATDGSYDVRAKGKLNIHGLDQERIVNVHIVTKGGVITVTAEFTVALADHNIKIPRVVNDKLAREINVSVNATLQAR